MSEQSRNIFKFLNKGFLFLTWIENCQHDRLMQIWLMPSASPLIIFSTVLILILFVLLGWEEKKARSKNHNSWKHNCRRDAQFWLLRSAADQLKFVSFWNLSFQKKMDRSFLNVQTCEKGEKKERAPMQFWFKEFIACCENDRAPTEEIVWHLKWKSEILCLRIKIHRIEWIVNYLISIHCICATCDPSRTLNKSTAQFKIKSGNFDIEIFRKKFCRFLKNIFGTMARALSKRIIS